MSKRTKQICINCEAHIVDLGNNSKRKLCIECDPNPDVRLKRVIRLCSHCGQRMEATIKYFEKRKSSLCEHCNRFKNAKSIISEKEQQRFYSDPKYFILFSSHLAKREVNGYIYCRVGIGHPMGGVSGDIGEHRLVMAAQLDRWLYSFERVHHINGNRADNNPNNLELWIIPHPKGIRMKDLLELYCD